MTIDLQSIRPGDEVDVRVIVTSGEWGKDCFLAKAKTKLTVGSDLFPWDCVIAHHPQPKKLTVEEAVCKAFRTEVSHHTLETALARLSELGYEIVEKKP